jgi:lipoprotein-anchoring transpeptidase ErfK/SrfK
LQIEELGYHNIDAICSEAFSPKQDGRRQAAAAIQFRTNTLREMRTSLGRAALLIFGVLPPLASAMAQDQRPCAQIRTACLNAGFIQGAARQGIGLQVHCVMPIMQASAQPPTARRPLPAIDPKIVAECRARNARSGQPQDWRSGSFFGSDPAATPSSPAPVPNATGSTQQQGVPYPREANAAPDNAPRPRVPMTKEQQQAVISALPAEDQPETGPAKSLPPQFRRTTVEYASKEPAGTIVIDTPHTYLYLVLGNGKAIRYGIGVGREGFTWSGAEKVTKMAEWPDWHPPEEMIERQPYLPRFMAGGEGNPLGARALYLGQTLYRIHGTNQPSTIGSFVSSGCIRLTNDDVKDLYGRVHMGTRVVVLPGNEASAPSRPRPKSATADKPGAPATSKTLPQAAPHAAPAPAPSIQASPEKNNAESDNTANASSARPAEPAEE